MFEDRPYELLKEMAAKHVMVKSIQQQRSDSVLVARIICPIYRKSGVLVALSTDDEGVSRIDLTHEYVRAVETRPHLPQLKPVNRTGLESTISSPAQPLARTGYLHSPRDPVLQRILALKTPPPAPPSSKPSEKAQQQ